ncbi:hypothetical protein D3C74_279480 [compost metagenome]
MDLLSDTLEKNTMKAGNLHERNKHQTPKRDWPAAGYRIIHRRRAGLRRLDRTRTGGGDGRPGFLARVGIHDFAYFADGVVDGTAFC